MKCRSITATCPRCLAEIPVDVTRTRLAPGKTALRFTDKSWADIHLHMWSHEEEKYKAAD